MNKTFNFFTFAPSVAGSPPALVLAMQLYSAVVPAVGASWWWMAAIVSILGIIGMLAVEVGTYKMLARAFAEKEWKAAGAAMVGALIVTGMIVFSVYAGAETKSLFTSTIIMLVGYLGVMVYEYLDRKHERVVEAVDTRQTEMQLRIELARQEASIERARIRAAKLGQPAPASNLSSGQVDTFDPAKLAKTREFLAANPDASGRDVARHLGVSPTTGNKYKAEAMK